MQHVIFNHETLLQEAINSNESNAVFWVRTPYTKVQTSPTRKCLTERSLSSPGQSPSCYKKVHIETRSAYATAYTITS
jgi:hypothetical protein